MDNYEDFEEEDFTAEISGKTLKRTLGLARPHWYLLVGFLLFISMAAVLDAVFTYLSKRIIDDAIIPQNIPELKRLATIYFGLILFQSANVFGFIYLAANLGERVQYDLRKRLFNHLQTLSFSYFDRTQVGWIMSRVTSDTSRVGDLISWGLLDTTWGITGILTSVVAMFLLNVRLALVVVLIVPALVIVALQFQKYILGEYRTVRKMNSKITGAYNENITGVRVVQALVREEANMQEFSGLTREMYRASYRAAWISALFLPVVQFIAALGIGITAWYGGWLSQTGGISVGTIQAFVSYITFMLWPIQEMARVYAEMQQAIASAERVFSLLDSEAEIQDVPNAKTLPDMRGDIRFDHVDFYYEPDKPVLTDFDLTVKQGETIALVGPTGAGKSTIINLMCRFYDPKKGKITVNGHDFRELTQQTIQSRVGIVLQTPHLFSGTVRDNILYGRPDATNDEVVNAGKLAGAHDFILSLEKGYNEDVGEGGGLLSVGQKQLISLARAILADPDIFIMDEATSSVDTLTEALIQKGMESIMHDRTSFVIAHRLSTIRKADRILVIDGGKIAEAGTHAELIMARGHYYRLYAKQFKAEKERGVVNR